MWDKYAFTIHRFDNNKINEIIPIIAIVLRWKRIDLSKKSKEELAAIAKRNIEAAKKKANSSIYIDGSSSESDSLDIQKTFINNSDYGGLATDSINAVKKELKIRKNK